MIGGALISLRAWRHQDVPLVTALRNNVALQSQLLARVRGSKESDVQEWLEKRSSGKDSLLLIIADVTTDTTLGYLQLTDIEPIDRRAEFGICLDPAVHKKGIGQEAIKLLLPYARNTWGLRKLSLRVRSDNVVALSCYERVGFKHCGLLRKHVFIDNSWLDLVLMEIFLDPELK